MEGRLFAAPPVEDSEEEPPSFLEDQIERAARALDVVPTGDRRLLEAVIIDGTSITSIARAKRLATCAVEQRFAAALASLHCALDLSPEEEAMRKTTSKNAPKIGPKADREGAAALIAKVTKIRYTEAEITPALALALLERNDLNRPIAAARVTSYARDMSSQDWRLNNQGLGFGADGKLYDGQHRLLAIVQSGSPAKMLVVGNLSPADRATIDQGRARSLGDTLRIVDGAAAGNRIVSWIRAIEHMITGRNIPLSHAMVRKQIARYGETLPWFVDNAPRTRPFYRATIIGALVYAHRAAPAQTETFTRRYASGAELPEESPILMLRSYVTSERFAAERPRIVSLKTLRCVEAEIQGERIERLGASEDTLTFFGRLAGERFN